MAEPINLNRFRKAKARAEGKAQAAVNRILHGRSKAEKQAAKAEVARQERRLDEAKREE